MEERNPEGGIGLLIRSRRDHQRRLEFVPCADRLACLLYAQPFSAPLEVAMNQEDVHRVVAWLIEAFDLDVTIEEPKRRIVTVTAR